MLDQILSIVMPLVVGAVVMYGMQLLKKASDYVDTLPALLKQLIVVLLSGLATVLSQAIGMEVPADMLHMDGTVVASLVSAGFAFLIHFLKSRLGVARK